MTASPAEGNGETAAENGGESLRKQLETLITDHLIELQRKGDRDRMREILIKIWDPASGEGFEQASLAFRRMARAHRRIQTAFDDGKLFPWTFTPAAAAAFEGIYEQSALFWLSVPQPKDPDKLAPSVKQLVSFQVGMLTAALGA